MTISNLMKMTEVLQAWRKHCGKRRNCSLREKMLVNSISFSHNVFYLSWKKFLFLRKFTLSYANAFNLDWSENLWFGKELTNRLYSFGLEVVYHTQSHKLLITWCMKWYCWLLLLDYGICWPLMHQSTLWIYSPVLIDVKEVSFYIDHNQIIALFPWFHKHLKSQFFALEVVKETIKVPIAANEKGVCFQNTSRSHSYHLKIWHLLWLYGKVMVQFLKVTVNGNHL